MADATLRTSGMFAAIASGLRGGPATLRDLVWALVGVLLAPVGGTYLPGHRSPRAVALARPLARPHRSARVDPPCSGAQQSAGGDADDMGLAAAGRAGAGGWHVAHGPQARGAVARPQPRQWYDCAWQFVANPALSLHWFNPLVWLAVRAQRVERERACDDAVVHAGTSASSYADHLLEIARTYHEPRRSAIAAVAMARRSQLEGRLLPGRRLRTNRRTALAVTVTMTALTASLAALTPSVGAATAHASPMATGPVVPTVHPRLPAAAAASGGPRIPDASADGPGGRRPQRLR